MQRDDGVKSVYKLAASVHKDKIKFRLMIVATGHEVSMEVSDR